MTVKSEDSHLDYSDQAALSTCLDSCKELLCKTILGLQEVPVNLWNLDIGLRYAITNIFECKGHGDAGPFNTLRQRFEKRKLALQIPKLQRAISAHIEKLNTFLALSNRREIQDSHERIEKRVVESHNLLAESLTDNGRLLDSISERLDTSQARIESQLQAILANQQKSKTPILSQSLDASSPEGRQTWMELGRLLRDEGITPDMIQNNRGLLIDAMKNTLRNKTVLAESASESYATAPEHPSHSITPLSASRQRDR